MKAVILAGGYGTRISEETVARPKPLVEIGGKPILWHIMKIYSSFGVDEFVICLGYKGYVIKEFFANYYLHMSDVTFDLRTNEMTVLRSTADPWHVTLVDTGEATMTGGRLQKIAAHVKNETFFCTYGDGVADVDIHALLRHHRSSQSLVTLTAVQPPGRFGALDIEGHHLRRFSEKPRGDGAWVNGGFFVIDPQALDCIEGDSTIWEREPLESLAAQGKVGVYKHSGFFQPLDTIRDRQILENLWASEAPPWRTWS